MKRILKIALCLVMCAALTLALCPAAGAIRANDCGLYVKKNESYTKDGKYYMSFAIQTGSNPNARYDQKTKIHAELFNSGGTRVVNWNAQEVFENNTITRNYGYNYNENLPADTYTLKLSITLCGNAWDTNTAGLKNVDLRFTWKYNINHNPTASAWLDNVQLVARDDGSYQNRFSFGFSGAKGKVLSMEIYDEWNNKVYSTQGNALSYAEGTNRLYWSGFPSGGGVKYDSGTYKIKFWLSGGGGKQSSVWLDIY